MAAINHTFTEVLTAQTTTSTSAVDIPGATISSSFFTTGKKYLIFINLQYSNSTSAARTQPITYHGTTAFAGAAAQRSANIDEYYTYTFFTVWTAVTSEGIKLSFDVTGGTATADQIFMLAINLSDDVTENTDWFFDEEPADSVLSTTPLAGASITFTPTAGHDWLVMSYAQILPGTITELPISRLVRSGEASSVLPETRLKANNANRSPLYTLARVFNLGASSNTFTEESSVNTGTTPQRTHSAIFALDLNKFRNHQNAYTEAELTLGSTNYANQIQTISITPDVSGDVWMGGNWIWDRNDLVTTSAKFRLQVDNTDQPTGQTTDNRLFDGGVDATDEDSFVISTMESLSAAAHTVDLDGSVTAVTTAPAAQCRTLWAVTMELAAGGSRLSTLMAAGHI